MPRKDTTPRDHLAVMENRGGFIKARAACSQSSYGRPRTTDDYTKVTCGVCRMTMAYDMAKREGERHAAT